MLWIILAGVIGLVIGVPLGVKIAIFTLRRQGMLIEDDDDNGETTTDIDRNIQQPK